MTTLNGSVHARRCYDKLVTGNIIFRKRIEQIGEFTPDLARRYGLTGPVLRGTGIPYDIRRAEPYSVYPEFDFEIPTETSGDCMASLSGTGA